jgi:hypothetical protein
MFLAQWLKHLLKPENDHLLPDTSQIIGSLSVRDLLKQAFDIRHFAVHREPAPSEDIIGLIRVARDILVAFDDSKGALMAHQYIVISLEIATATEGNNDEIYTLQILAERESKRALHTACLSIRTRLENRLRSQLQPLLYITSNIESKAQLEPVSSLSLQKLSLIDRNAAYRAMRSTAQQTAQLLFHRPWVVLLVAHFVMIFCMLCALQCINT